MLLSATASMVLSPLKKRRSVMRALKMLRTKLIATMALTLLSGGTSAIAQNQGAGSSVAASSTIPEAPIGHRQPRADQPPRRRIIFRQGMSASALVTFQSLHLCYISGKCAKGGDP